jgi:glycosyltransferase involved in cell wall biosynthesis
MSVKRKAPFIRIAKLFGKKVVVHLHCGSQLPKIWDHSYERLFRMADVCLVLGEVIKKDVVFRLGPDSCSKVRVLYNPCPQIEYELSGKDSIVLFAGLLIPEKGYADLIDAFSRVAAKYPEWSLILAGDGRMDEARKLASDLGIEPRVQFTGWVSGKEKEKLFKRAAVFCLPSYDEGVPASVMEAVSSRAAIVVSNVGGIPEVVQDGYSALLIAPGDNDSLASSLSKLISDPCLRHELADNAANYAESHFSMDIIAQQLRDIYNYLLDNE